MKTTTQNATVAMTTTGLLGADSQEQLLEAFVGWMPLKSILARAGSGTLIKFLCPPTSGNVSQEPRIDFELSDVMGANEPSYEPSLDELPDLRDSLALELEGVLS